MVVTRRQNVVGNIEVLSQTQKLNGSTNGQVLNQDRSCADSKLAARKISSVAKKYFKFFSYPIECLLCVIAIFYMVLILSPLIIAYNVLKFIERRWAYFKSGAVAMSGQDALWMQDSKENRLIINSHMVVECSDIHNLVEGVQTALMRCIAKKNDNGKPTFPRFTKCIHPGIFQYFLKETTHFDITQHVFTHNGPVPKSHAEMEELVSTLGTNKDISFNNPPWCFIIIPKTYEGNEALILFRAHHGMADGVSLTRFLLEFFPDEKLTENKLMVKFSNVDRKYMYLKGVLSGARMLVDKIISSPDHSIIHGNPLKGVKKMSWSKPISLEGVKKIKNYVGMTVNDVLMACVSMSFHDYFKAHGVANPPDITASVPVDVRPKHEPLELKNNFAIVSMKLPVSTGDPMECLHATKAHMDNIKHSGEAFVLAIGANLTVEYMPECVTTLWNTPIANKHSFVFSNVPGSQEQFSVAGHKVTEIFFAPPQRDLVGIGVGIYSYAGQFSIGVQSDLNCMTDPKWVVNAFELRLAQLEKSVVAGK